MPAAEVAARPTPELYPPVLIVYIGAPMGPRGGVATQRTANPCTGVRFPPRPPASRNARLADLCPPAPNPAIEASAGAGRYRSRRRAGLPRCLQPSQW